MSTQVAAGSGSGTSRLTENWHNSLPCRAAGPEGCIACVTQACVNAGRRPSAPRIAVGVRHDAVFAPAAHRLFRLRSRRGAGLAHAQQPPGRQAARPSGRPSAAAAPPPKDPVVATVNGHPIYLSELEVAQQALPPQYRSMPLQSVFPALLDRIIDSKLVVADGKKNKIEVDPAFKRPHGVRRGPGDPGLLAAEGGRQAHHRRQAAAALPGEAQVDAGRGRGARAPHPGRHRAGGEGPAWPSSRRAPHFDKLAREKSTDKASGAEGGDLGWFKRTDMVKEFSDAAFALKKGELSEAPVKTQFGFHLIKVEDRRAGAAAELRRAVRPDPRGARARDGDAASSTSCARRQDREVQHRRQQGRGRSRAAPPTPAAPARAGACAAQSCPSKTHVLRDFWCRLSRSAARTRDRAGRRGKNSMAGKPALSPLAPKTTPTLPRDRRRQARRGRFGRALQGPRRRDAGAAAGRRDDRRRPDQVQDVLGAGRLVPQEPRRAARCGRSWSMPATPTPSPASWATRRSRRAPRAVAQALGCPRNEVFMASTGVIGQPLDWEKIAAARAGADQGRARGQLGGCRRGDHDHRHLSQGRHPPGQDRRAHGDPERLPQGLGHDRARHGDHAGLRLHRRQDPGRRAAEAARRCRRQVASTASPSTATPRPATRCCWPPPAPRAMRRSRRPTTRCWSTSSARSTRC